MKLQRFVGSSLVHMDFTMTVIVFLYFKEKLRDHHWDAICGAWEKQLPEFAGSSSRVQEAMISPGWRLRSHIVVLDQPHILRKSILCIRLHWSCEPWQWAKWTVKKPNNFLMAADFLAGRVSSELCMGCISLPKPTHFTKHFDLNKSVVFKKWGKKKLFKDKVPS